MSRHSSTLLIVCCILVWSVLPSSAAALFVSNGRITSRAIERTAQTRHALESIDRREGRVRERSEPFSIAGIRREERLRETLTDVSTSTPGPINREKFFQTPVLDVRDEPSVYSTTPVTVDAEVAYRSGIKYFLGSDGVKKDVSFSYMWLNFALAQGHPLARGALQRVIRSMSPSQLVEAQERTTLLAQRFLDLRGRERSLIRDRERQRDLMSLLAALQRFRSNNVQGVLPVSIRAVAREICRFPSSNCRDLLNFVWLVPDYTLRIPADPLTELAENGTGYFAVLGEAGQTILFAPQSEVFFAVVADEAFPETPLDQETLEQTFTPDVDEMRGYNRPLRLCLQTSGTGGTVPLTVYFTLGCVPWEPATVRWDFGDGFTALGNLAPVHTYEQPGSFTVTITAEGLHGRYARHQLTVEVAE